MQIGDTSLWSKDVQRLLWAAGEARERVRRRELKRVALSRQADETGPSSGADFFTEWQPALR